MKIITSIFDLNKEIKNYKNIGFVPTMGGIHNGHISLIKASQKKKSKTIVSIFVNPTQFNNKNDFKKYPRNLKKDLRILKKLKVNFAYIPTKKQIFNSKNPINIRLSKKDKILCAKYRKGHFEGVIDVMTRLTNKIKPSKIFMGEKDFQQFILVKRFIEKNYKSKVILCKTIRNKNKLALSSRNLHLSKNDLVIAEKISKSLISFKKQLSKKLIKSEKILSKKKELSEKFDIDIEYFEVRDINKLFISKKMNNSKIFIAYYLNKIRLIDNF